MPEPISEKNDLLTEEDLRALQLAKSLLKDASKVEGEPVVPLQRPGRPNPEEIIMIKELKEQSDFVVSRINKNAVRNRLSPEEIEKLIKFNEQATREYGFIKNK